MQPSSRRPCPICVNGKIVLEGPLVVPSYSSKALPRISVDTALERTANFIVSPVLVSAYDIRYHGVDLGRFKVPLIIVDSGGYEMLVDEEGRRRGGNADHAAYDWSASLYADTLAGIDAAAPIIAVSYDNGRQSIGEQIEAALAARITTVGSCILLKPEGSNFLTIDAIAEDAAKLGAFDVIGVTEKEAGASLLDRLLFVARLRALLDDHGIPRPVHVFGALDPFMTPLFFVAGADIVDGITWLRFEFSDSGAHYLQSGAALADPGGDIGEVEWRIRRSNYRRAVDMQIAFRRFLHTGRVSDLSKDVELVEAMTRVWSRMEAALRLAR